MRAKIILVIAILFGVAATLLLMNYLDKVENEKRVITETVEVVAAAISIDANEMITDAMLVVIKVPKEYINSGYVTKKEDAVNKLSLSYVAKNEVISSSRLLDVDKEGNILSQRIRKDYVAVTIDVTNEQSVGQLIIPNDTVNVIYSLVDHVDIEGNVFYNTSTIFRNIDVLSIDRMLYVDSLTEEYIPYESITLEMSNENAEKLVQYKLQGEIGVVLNSRVIQ